MPTVVDSLIVQLGLDATQFNRAQREVNDSWQKARGTSLKSGKDIEENNQKLLNSFNKLKVEAVGFLAALLGAREIKEFVANITSANAAVGRLSESLGENPQMLSAWGMAVERAGGKSEDAANALSGLSKAFFDLKNNGKQLPDAINRVFSQIDAPFKNPYSARNLDDFLNQYAANLKQLATHDKVAAYQWGNAVTSSTAMTSLMIDKGGDLSKYVESIQGLGATNKQIEDSEKLIEKWATLEQTAKSIGRDIEGWFNPTFLAILNGIQKVFDDIHGVVSQGPTATAKQLQNNLHDPSASGEYVPGSVGGNLAPSGAGGGAGAAWSGQGAPPSLRRRGSPSAGKSVPVDTGGATIPGFTPEETQSYLNILGNRESGNTYMGNNAQGYGGRWQMGPGEVAGTGATRDANWYKNVGGAQDASMMKYTLQHYNELLKAGVIKPGMSPQQVAGYLAAAHLGGVGGAIALSKGEARRDANGTPTSEYFRMMSGLGSGNAAGANPYPMANPDGSNSHGRFVTDPDGSKRWLGWNVSPPKPGEIVPRDPDTARIATPADVQKDNAAGAAQIKEWEGAKKPSPWGTLQNYWNGIPGGGAGIPGGTTPLSSLQNYNPVTTSDTSNAMHINGGIHVNAPQATDSDGIASGIADSLRRYSLVMTGQSGQV